MSDATEKTVKSHVPDVFNFAFITPVYDYAHIDDESPACNADCVGWRVWKWMTGGQRWQRGNFYDDPHEAREEAEAHHAKVFKKLKVKQEAHLYDVPAPPERCPHCTAFAEGLADGWDYHDDTCVLFVEDDVPEGI